MNKDILFSILIANYNNGQYLLESLESVFNQTYVNWEIILVDDGSTDDSFEIYKIYERDSRFHIYYNDSNQGVGYTKRRCAEFANGEICGFLDPDDVLLPKAIELMVSVFCNNKDVALVFSRMYECDSNLNIISESRLLEIPIDKTYFTNLDYGTEHFAAYVKNCYDLTEGISAKCLGGEDLDMYFKLEEVGKIYILNEFTYKYRSGVSNSVTNSRFYEDHLWGIIAKHEACVRRGLDTNIYVLQYLKMFGDYMYDLGYHDAERKVSKSKSYRFGRLILKPLSFIFQGIKR
jgi:glycosyltransferase involved in cell wall biosynthesis